MNQNLPIGPQPDQPRADAQRPTSSALYRDSASRQTPFFSAPPDDTPPVAPGRKSWRVGTLGGVVAAGILLGALYGFSAGGSSAPPAPPPSAPSPSSPVAAAPDQLKTFAVAPVDADRKATDQLKALLSSGGAAGGAADRLDSANAPALRALAKTAPKVADEIKSGRRTLYRVYLLDFLNQDGDHAELFVDGMSYGDIALQNSGTSLLIPLMAGTPAHLKLVAKVDGGGGVTVAFISSLGEARTRVMQVGDYDQWQVIAQ